MFLVLRWFLFSLIVPGAGFWRAGKPHFAIGASLSLLPLPAAVFIYSFAPLKFVWLLIFAVVVVLGAMIAQAVMGAMAAREPVARWPSVLVFAVAVLLLNNLLGGALSWRIAPFKTPSDSMKPTLVTGDQFYILTDRARYPIERGAVIVHHNQERGFDYVKRVVGIEGDAVDWDGETLTINGTALQKGACEEDAPAGCHTEQLGRRKWRVITTSARMLPGRWEVPPGHVFTLGDNRDNSLDSRSTGAVPLEEVKGVAQVIHFSWPDLLRSGRSLDLAL